ncbi:MAG: lipocalin family protein [Bacteroidota bacterium]
MNIFILSLFLMSSFPELKTVSNIDLQKYSGTWYEIARLPNSFEKGLKNITATYEIIDGSHVRVINKGVKENDGTVSTARGKAKIPNLKEPGKLKVTFFWPFYGKYWVFHLDEKDYQYALVGHPNRNYFWILARTPKIDETLYQSLLKIAADNSFDVSKVIRPQQD